MIIRRLGIIGDVHAANVHLEIALRLLKQVQVDATVCVGDITDGVGDAERCCLLLENHEIITVRGNHDRWFLGGELRDLLYSTPADSVGQRARSFLQSLPATHELKTSMGLLLLCHGTGTDDMQQLLPDDLEYALQCNSELQRVLAGGRYRFMVGGHTHRRMVRHIGPLTAINPGLLHDAVQPGSETGLAVADFESAQIQYYDFQSGELVVAGEPISLASL